MKLAKSLLKRSDWVVMDTETTGLDDQAQAVQIGILSPSGDVLIDRLIKPTIPIPPEASQIHGIYDRHVATAQTIVEMEPELRGYLEGQIVVVYNAPYDARILIQSFRPHYPERLWHWSTNINYADIMEPYTNYWGEWSDYHGCYKWQRLTAACAQQGVEIEDAHSAIGDCRMTLALIRKLAGDL